MALSVGIQQRQNQSLALTPQLVQSIKLLQMSSIELMHHVAQEVERNPLLELDEGFSQDGSSAASADGQDGKPDLLQENERAHRNLSSDQGADAGQERRTSDRSADVSGDLDTSTSALEDKLDTTFENEFDSDRSGGEAGYLPAGSGTAGYQDFSQGASDGADIGEFVASRKSLRDHLLEQLALTRLSAGVRMAATQIIDSLDEDGFLRRPDTEIAKETGADGEAIAEALEAIQGFDPPGIAARSLGECLAIQLREKNHLDPAMERLLDNLELLAKRDFEKLQQLCEVSFDDLMDMVDEIRSLDPRPARAFDTATVQGIIPDVFVHEKPDGSFAVELNSDALPRVLVNQSYTSLVVRGPHAAEQKAFVAECLQNANWLVRSLEQRAQTILKVMTEIVRQQDGFFAHGVRHLRPMSLRQVADQIKMHESTVSRVTSGKYVQTRRGTYELKYFFTAAIASTQGEDLHSAESVRQRIRSLIEAEAPDAVLSDDALVEELKSEGIDIARRTVAKYRESLHLPSSVQRRREKRALARRG